MSVDTIITTDQLKFNRLKLITIQQTVAGSFSATPAYAHGLNKYPATEVFYRLSTSNKIYPAYGDGVFTSVAAGEYLTVTYSIDKTNINLSVVNNDTNQIIAYIYILLYADTGST